MCDVTHSVATSFLTLHHSASSWSPENSLFVFTFILFTSSSLTFRKQLSNCNNLPARSNEVFLWFGFLIQFNSIQYNLICIAPYHIIHRLKAFYIVLQRKPNKLSNRKLRHFSSLLMNTIRGCHDVVKYILFHLKSSHFFCTLNVN